jgi:hypothetical protein
MWNGHRNKEHSGLYPLVAFGKHLVLAYFLRTG